MCMMQEACFCCISRTLSTYHAVMVIIDVEVPGEADDYIHRRIIHSIIIMLCHAICIYSAMRG